jgi:hypothetical protein
VQFCVTTSRSGAVVHAGTLAGIVTSSSLAFVGATLAASAGTSVTLTGLSGAEAGQTRESETEIASEQTIGLTSPRDALDPELALLAKVKRTARYSEGERVLEHFRRSSDFLGDNRRVCLKGLMG